MAENPWENEESFPPKWRARAEMYAAATVASYYEGELWGIPLPAMPGDGSTFCLTRCKCHWRIETIDEKAGDWDAYRALIPTEHSQTCRDRAERWKPRQIRNYTL